jgi:GR25 family glycosyltransferase involved in LPS biosynthesis
MGGTLPVHVISLRDSEFRRRKVTERLGAIGIPFQFVDAIDGRTQRLPDVFEGTRVVRDGF